MSNISTQLDALRGMIDPHQMTGILLREVAETLGETPDLHGGLDADWQQFRKNPSYPHLQAAARSFLEMTRAERLAALPLLANMGGSRSGLNLIEATPAKMIADLAGHVSSVRCSFSSAAMPALQIALAASDAGREVHVRFIDFNTGHCNLMKLAAAAIEVSIDVVADQPFSRADGGTFEAEICMPPFGVDVRERKDLPLKTLERIDAAERGRLHFEPVAMADILVHAPSAKVVISFSAGALFRTVGIEVVARGEIVNSGRLAAVFAVPPGMIYTKTGIATCIVVLEPEGSDNKDVRFLDLADEKFGARTIRGRYDFRLDAPWAEAITCEVDENTSWARDVNVHEIHEQSDVLAVERYLQTEAARALAVFLSKYKTVHLGDLVEVIRPGAIPKTEDGEYTIHEASPGDIRETGFLGLPARETKVARGTLRRARNQQVRPGDVLFSVKGTIGRVGIVPDNVPDKNDESFWTAGQSLVILRTQGRIAAEVLYEYLSFDLVQNYLGSLAGGAAIQSISARDLASLQIPLLSKKEEARVQSEFAQRQQAFEEIRRLRQVIDDLRDESWPRPALGTKESDQ